MKIPGKEFFFNDDFYHGARSNWKSIFWGNILGLCLQFMLISIFSVTLYIPYTIPGIRNIVGIIPVDYTYAFATALAMICSFVVCKRVSRNNTKGYAPGVLIYGAITIFIHVSYVLNGINIGKNSIVLIYSISSVVAIVLTVREFIVRKPPEIYTGALDS